VRNGIRIDTRRSDGIDVRDLDACAGDAAKFFFFMGPLFLVPRTVAEPGAIKNSFFVAQRLPARLERARRKTHKGLVKCESPSVCEVAAEAEMKPEDPSQRSFSRSRSARS
jgi:hypothetical protein